MGKKPLVVLAGPTAIGKTETSIQIAKAIGGEIISTDSMQIYKYMDIGTAKIREDEMEGIPHYLVGEIEPDEKFSVSDFQEKAKAHINDIISRGKIPMLVGGTGFYINSILYDLDFSNSVSDSEFRAKYETLAKEHGNEYIYEELKKVDLKSYERLHLNDTKRIIRALEVYHVTGKPMSEGYTDFRKYSDEYDVMFFVLNMDRQKLYDRINLRVDLMIEAGLLEEVKQLLNQGFDKDLTSMQGLGYKEIVKYLDGECSLDEALETLKRDTRRFAKRQLTWFRREEKAEWINVDEYKNRKEVAEYCIERINENLK